MEGSAYESVTDLAIHCKKEGINLADLMSDAQLHKTRKSLSGKSILVLDKEHSKRVKSKAVLSLIPATVIGYTGRSDHFEVLSAFDRFIDDGIFSIEKRKLTKILLDNEMNPTSSTFNCFLNFQRICQKIIFSHLNDQQVGLMKEEIDFILKLADIKPLTTRKLVGDLIKETANNKITDYF